MKRLLGFLLLLTIFASAGSYAGILAPEVKKEIAPAVQSDDSYEHATFKDYGSLYSVTGFRRISNVKYRILFHFSPPGEFGFANPVKQFTAAFSGYPPYVKPIGLKLIYPQHYFW